MQNNDTSLAHRIQLGREAIQDAKVLEAEAKRTGNRRYHTEAVRLVGVARRLLARPFPMLTTPSNN